MRLDARPCYGDPMNRVRLPLVRVEFFRPPPSQQQVGGAGSRVCFRGESGREVPEAFVAHIRRFEGGLESSRRRKAAPAAAIVVVVFAVAVGTAADVVACSRGRKSGSPANSFENGQDGGPRGRGVW